MQEASSVSKAMKNSLWVTGIMVITTIASASVNLFAGRDPGWINFVLKQTIATVAYALITFLISWAFFAFRRRK